MTRHKIIVRTKGGPGSGHHGHSGLPGKHGGSRPSGGGKASTYTQWEGREGRDTWLNPTNDAGIMHRMGVKEGSTVNGHDGVSRLVMSPPGGEPEKRVRFEGKNRWGNAARFVERNKLSGILHNPSGFWEFKDGKLVRNTGLNPRAYGFLLEGKQGISK